MPETAGLTDQCMKESAHKVYLVFMRTTDDVEIQIDVALVDDSKAFKQGDFTC